MYRVVKNENGFIVTMGDDGKTTIFRTELPFMEWDLIDVDDEYPIKCKMVDMCDALMSQEVLRMIEQGSPDWLISKELMNRARTNPSWLRGDELIEFLAKREIATKLREEGLI